MMIVIDGIIEFYLLLSPFFLFNVPLNLHILDLEFFEFGFSQVTIHHLSNPKLFELVKVLNVDFHWSFPFKP
jgi:hypothetical protein